MAGKSKDEQMAEKKQELEKRLQDVTGQLGTVKKTTKKGSSAVFHFSFGNFSFSNRRRNRFSEGNFII